MGDARDPDMIAADRWSNQTNRRLFKHLKLGYIHFSISVRH